MKLQELAQAIADALPANVEEVMLAGSASRGVADEFSDIEMLVVTPEPFAVDECFAHAKACGLTKLGTWGLQGGTTQKVSGYRDGVPIELIWWSRADTEKAIDAIFAGQLTGSADAFANGVALRTSGAIAEWRDRFRVVPDDLAEQWIEEAALTWGGFAAASLLTIVRPGERLALVERMVDDASRVVRIVYLVNRAWPPTSKRLAARTASLPVKPDRLAERIEEALTEPDPVCALRVMTELQADAAALAPDGPNIVRARAWLAEGIEILKAHA